jgi:hypothetical protein
VAGFLPHRLTHRHPFASHVPSLSSFRFSGSLIVICARGQSILNASTADDAVTAEVLANVTALVDRLPIAPEYKVAPEKKE